MKTKLFFLATLLFAMNYSFSQSTKRNDAPPPCDYLCQAQQSYDNGNCREAQLNYKMAVKFNKRSDQNLNKKINDCIPPKSGMVSSGIDADNLPKLPADLEPFNENIGYNNDDVKKGNLAYKKGDYILAAHYFLQYLTNNRNLFNKDSEKRDKFYDRIEDCL